MFKEVKTASEAFYIEAEKLQERLAQKMAENPGRPVSSFPVDVTDLMLAFENVRGVAIKGVKRTLFGKGPDGDNVA
jgi:hypothetical protein